MNTHRRHDHRSPLIIGLGAGVGQGSATDIALLASLKAAELAGANTRFFGGPYLAGLPVYDAVSRERTLQQKQFLETVSAADGLIIATPALHGQVSSLLQNAMDLMEDLRNDRRPYLQDRAVACVVTGLGTQCGGAALRALREAIHALRGWPTPLGVTVDLCSVRFDVIGRCADTDVARGLQTAGRQVAEFALARLLYIDDFETGRAPMAASA